MRKCKNTGSFSTPVYTCVEADQKRSVLDKILDEVEEELEVQKRACIALGATGCEGNNGKCCREGNPYTGTMRKCKNTGSFSAPVYTCVEADQKRSVLEKILDEVEEEF